MCALYKIRNGLFNHQISIIEFFCQKNLFVVDTSRAVFPLVIVIISLHLKISSTISIAYTAQANFLPSPMRRRGIN